MILVKKILRNCIFSLESNVSAFMDISMMVVSEKEPEKNLPWHGKIKFGLLCLVICDLKNKNIN